MTENPLIGFRIATRVIHPPTQETTALAVEECVAPNADFPMYPYLASADFAGG
jgi:hypothetical protein